MCFSADEHSPSRTLLLRCSPWRNHRGRAQHSLRHPTAGGQRPGRSVGGVSGRDALHTLALPELPLVLLVDRKSPVTAAAQLWESDKIETPLLCLPSAEAVCRNFQQGLARLEVDWFPSMEMSSIDLIETYVAAGFGIGLSVQVPKARMSPNLRVVALPDFAPVILGALW